MILKPIATLVAALTCLSFSTRPDVDPTETMIVVVPPSLTSCKCEASMNLTGTSTWLSKCPNTTDLGIQVTWESPTPEKGSSCLYVGGTCKTLEESTCFADFAEAPLVISQHNCLVGVQLQIKDGPGANWSNMSDPDTSEPQLITACTAEGETRDTWSILFRIGGSGPMYPLFLVLVCSACKEQTVPPVPPLPGGGN